MAEQIIVCPHCNKEIPLTEAITHKIQEDIRKKFEADSRKREEEFTKREDIIVAKEKEIIRSQELIKEEVAKKLELEKPKLEREATKKAEEKSALKLKALNDEIVSTDKKLQEAQKNELELRKQRKELENREQFLELEIARKVDAGKARIQQDAIRKADDEHLLKDREKEKHIADLRRQIGDLKRKAEQGSQQMQGEVLELELEEMLKSAFPYDLIEPVPKGIRGADVLQKVNNPVGQYCGTIIWELKRTKTWSNGWVDKLKNDQRDMKAEIAVLMTIALPKEINSFGCCRGVWITNCASAISLATALRMGIVEAANIKQATVGKHEKMEILYSYLSGSEFRQKIEGIVEAFVSMKQDLDGEKRAMEKIWAKREKQIVRVIRTTAKMYGDMQGIIGASLPQIKNLELKELTD